MRVLHAVFVAEHVPRGTWRLGGSDAQRLDALVGPQSKRLMVRT